MANLRRVLMEALLIHLLSFNAAPGGQAQTFDEDGIVDGQLSKRA